MFFSLQQSISVYFTTLRLAVDKKMEERGKLITKFNVQLQKDIKSLTDKVTEINEEVTVKIYLQLNIKILILIFLSFSILNFAARVVIRRYK